MSSTIYIITISGHNSKKVGEFAFASHTTACEVLQKERLDALKLFRKDIDSIIEYAEREERFPQIGDGDAWDNVCNSLHLPYVGMQTLTLADATTMIDPTQEDLEEMQERDAIHEDLYGPIPELSDEEAEAYAKWREENDEKEAIREQRELDEYNKYCAETHASNHSELDDHKDEAIRDDDVSDMDR